MAVETKEGGRPVVQEVEDRALAGHIGRASKERLERCVRTLLEPINCSAEVLDITEIESY